MRWGWVPLSRTSDSYVFSPNCSHLTKQDPYAPTHPDSSMSSTNTFQRATHSTEFIRYQERIRVTPCPHATSTKNSRPTFRAGKREIKRSLVECPFYDPRWVELTVKQALGFKWNCWEMRRWRRVHLSKIRSAQMGRNGEGIDRLLVVYNKNRVERKEGDTLTHLESSLRIIEVRARLANSKTWLTRTRWRVTKSTWSDPYVRLWSFWKYAALGLPTCLKW
jgi:hypothetical protein